MKTFAQLASLLSTAMLLSIAAVFCLFALLVNFWLRPYIPQRPQKSPEMLALEGLWQAPDTLAIASDAPGTKIRYGKELISHTARYFGPEGKLTQSSNGLNCQSCHLEAGTKPFGNNYAAVAATYPKYRARSGTTESIEKRINDCFERSLNGQAIAEDSPEMQAMVAYMQWLGQNVPKGEKPKGAGIVDLPYLSRAASPEKGKALYLQKCASCHQAKGQGLKQAGAEWLYPPLWGAQSFNEGAGLYRISRLAGFLKSSMPLGASFQKPILSDEEAWDIAAYIESMPHPKMNLQKDWPNIAQKPIDHPFGPFADGFSEVQHKYGPFAPIVSSQKRP